MSRPTVALCLIAKNEEENLPRLFDSLKDCFDEVHLTDTGSTDNTVEIAKKLGSNVNHFTWVNDFSAARNYSFSHAKSDYIMWLDCDDVLDNAEKFKLFRDNAMGLADYWMANYHYTLDPSGNPLCTFARERVVKREKALYWKYPIHEGITPSADCKCQFIPTWSVKHMRTDQDLVKDRSRNLNLFEGLRKIRGLDARMKYYYGKELFEAGKPLESITSLGEAISDPKLELHDRILAMQYICYAYIMCNQFEQALQIAHQGLMLAPNRAEFYCIVGDCYIKMNRMGDAAPSYEAAKKCARHNGVIFSNGDLYTTYPRNQLARIYFNNGNVEAALEESLECARLFNDKEAREIRDEVAKTKNLVFAYTESKPCDDIVFTTAPQTAYEFDTEVAKQKAMGGSETALIEMAHWIHKKSGRPVKVFNMRKEPKTCDGVEYIPADRVHEYFKDHRPYFHVAWRHNNKLTDAPTFVWAHDLITPGVEAHQNYERMLCLTPFHKRYAMTMQGIPENKIHVTRNGIKPERFKDGPWKKDPYRFVFGSSPDRGLDRCMLVLDEVRKKYPQVTLHIHYGWDHLHRYGLQSLADKLASMVKARPWVTYHGATQQDALMASYKASSYIVQPSDFIETSMISAMELLACGVYPIMRKIGGVADTLSEAESNGMATLVDSDCIKPEEYQLYVNAVLRALDENCAERVKIEPDRLAWSVVAEEWLRDLPALAGVNGQSG